MKSKTVLRLVVTFDHPDLGPDEVGALVRALEDYAPRLQEDMDDVAEAVDDRTGVSVEPFVSIESSQILTEE